MADPFSRYMQVIELEKILKNDFLLCNGGKLTVTKTSSIYQRTF